MERLAQKLTGLIKTDKIQYSMRRSRTRVTLLFFWQKQKEDYKNTVTWFSDLPGSLGITQVTPILHLQIFSF